MVVLSTPRRGPLSRAGRDHPSWAALLDAGLDVVAEAGVGALTTGAVAARAGLAKGTFYVHFPTRDDFLVSLHRRCRRELERRLRVRCGGLTPGYPRLVAGLTEFLEVCHHFRGTSGLLILARFEPALGQEVAEMTERAVAAVVSELAEAQPEAAQTETALLLILAAVELAGLESAADRRLARHRAALVRLMKRSG